MFRYGLFNRLKNAIAHIFAYPTSLNSLFFASFTRSKIIFTTFTLIACLYACVSETTILKLSGKPCKRKHSLGVSLRMRSHCKILGVCPPPVAVVSVGAVPQVSYMRLMLSFPFASSSPTTLIKVSVLRWPGFVVIVVATLSLFTSLGSNLPLNFGCLLWRYARALSLRKYFSSTSRSR